MLVIFVAVALVLVWKFRPRQVESEATRGTDAGAPEDGEAMQLIPELAGREKRAELRQKILEAWAKGEQGEAAAKDAKRGRFEEHPNEHGEGIDKRFVGQVLGEQLVPMLNACYEEMHARRPDAGAGLVKVWFKIVADDQLGGIVEDDDEHDGGMVTSAFADEGFETCVRESTMTLTFPPPAHGGVVKIGVPLAFSPGDAE